MHPFDKVTKNGKTVGVSTWVGYSANEGKMLTLAMLDRRARGAGTEVTFVWGEETAARPSRPSSATSRWRSARWSAPVPYVEVARTSYARGLAGRARLTGSSI